MRLPNLQEGGRADVCSFIARREVETTDDAISKKLDSPVVTMPETSRSAVLAETEQLLRVGAQQAVLSR